MSDLTRPELDDLPLHLEERKLVLEWMLQEWERYSNAKFGLLDGPPDDHDESMRLHGFMPGNGDGAFWLRQVTQYFSRAQLYGIGEPGSAAPDKGQQAMLKALMTLFDCCACMIRVHGLPPAPGQTSGDTEEWRAV